MREQAVGGQGGNDWSDDSAREEMYCIFDYFCFSSNTRKGREDCSKTRN